MKSTELLDSQLPGSENIVNGKINWRGWVLYPNDLPEHVRSILDTMAEFTELTPDIKGEDDLEKFDVFTRLASAKGLITKEEYEDIQGWKYKSV